MGVVQGTCRAFTEGAEKVKPIRCLVARVMLGGILLRTEYSYTKVDM